MQMESQRTKYLLFKTAQISYYWCVAMLKCFQGLGSTHPDRPPLSSLTPWTQKGMRKWVKRKRGYRKEAGMRFFGVNS